MPSASCSEHTDRNALFRCEGCHRALCEECVEQGHRLLFCAHCRERAMPLADGGPETTAGLLRERHRSRPYRLSDALAYAWRGRGALTIPAWLVFVAGVSLLPWMAAIAVGLLAMLLIPGFLFEIVRSTWEEEDELPEWPDYSDLVARLAECRDAVGVAISGALPVVLFRRLGGCDLESFLVADRDLCPALTAAGLAVGFALALFGFGAVGAFRSGWLGFRVDLHLEALLAGTRGEAPLFALLVALLLGIGLFVARAAVAIPLVGLLAFHATAAYCVVTGAHLAGLLFRRHRQRLEAIYLG